MSRASPAGATVASGIERPTALDADPGRIVAALGGPNALILDGRFESGQASDAGWGPVVGVSPRVVVAMRPTDAASASSGLATIDAMVAARRAAGGPRGCGLAVLVAYEWFDPRPEPGPASALPSLAVWAVDAAIRFDGAAGVAVARPGCEALLDGLEDRIQAGHARAGASGGVRASADALRTSLPREPYLRAVRQVKEHIRRGDIYQANLTQRFELRCAEAPIDVYRRLVAAAPAPRAAFVSCEAFAVASASPETFLHVDANGRIRTVPIKGTRRRGATPEVDRLAAEELLRSEKDRAELTMIVDLERNDLGRLCRPGSIRVSAPPQLRSYSAVHHLVAEVEGELRPATPPSEILRATFPGGSITGAPKIRAMEILRALEPVPRGFYTGSLFWFGDDGTIDSSILIRSVVLADGVARVGAGGGVVADSDPDAEWRESNDKARAMLGVLGGAPEDAA